MSKMILFFNDEKSRLVENVEWLRMHNLKCLLSNNIVFLGKFVPLIEYDHSHNRYERFKDGDGYEM